VTVFSLFLLGTVGFVAITAFEQLPVLGWLGALVSVVAWLTMSRECARAAGGAATAWATILGAWTGFVGAVSAWALQTGNLFGLETAPLSRIGAGFGFVGATLGIAYWPLVGAGLCFAFALYFTGRRGLPA
jgi:hypothetical protein